MLKMIYECDCCHKEFKEPTYLGTHSMSFLNLKIVEHTNPSTTIGADGETITLCDKCTTELRKKLREMGFKTRYIRYDEYKL